MSYQVIIPKPVQKQLDKISRPQRERILAAIRLLKNDPRPDGVKKLKALDDTYRIRIGDYRVVYEIRDQELIIFLLNAAHRKDVYGTGNANRGQAEAN